MNKSVIECGNKIDETVAALNVFFWNAPDQFLLWLGSQFALRIHPFERKMIEADFEVLTELSTKLAKPKKGRGQLALL